MATMKGKKVKEVADEAAGQEVVSQPCPIAGDKRKNLLVGVDLGNLPSRRREKSLNIGCPSLRTSSPLRSSLCMSLWMFRSMMI